MWTTFPTVRVGRRLWLELATHLRNSGLQRSVEWHLRDKIFKVAAERLDGVGGIAKVESQLCIPGIGGERDAISGLGIRPSADWQSGGHRRFGNQEAIGGLAIRRRSAVWQSASGGHQWLSASLRWSASAVRTLRWWRCAQPPYAPFLACARRCRRRCAPIRPWAR